MLVSFAALGILPGLERVQQLLDLPTNAFGLATGALAMLLLMMLNAELLQPPAAFPWQLLIFSNQQQQASALELRVWCLACVSRPIGLCH